MSDMLVGLSGALPSPPMYTINSTLKVCFVIFRLEIFGYGNCTIDSEHNCYLLLFIYLFI